MGTYRVELWLRLATTEIGQGPRRIAKHAELGCRLAMSKQGLQSASSQYMVTTLRRVTGDVSKSPHGLFGDIGVPGAEQLHEDLDSSMIHDSLGVATGAGSDVGQGPGCLKLQLGMIVECQEVDQARNNAGVDDLLNGRIALYFVQTDRALERLKNESTLHAYTHRWKEASGTP